MSAAQDGDAAPVQPLTLIEAPAGSICGPDGCALPPADTTVPEPSGHPQHSRTRKEAPVSAPITQLDQLNVAWADRFNEGDVDGILELFADGAVFVPQPGTPVTGEGLRAATEQFLSLRLPVSLNVRHTFESGDYGLVVADWSLEGTDPAGNQVSLAGSTSDVAARGADGGWKFVIDNPFGTA